MRTLQNRALNGIHTAGVASSKLALPTKNSFDIKGLHLSSVGLFCLVREKYGKQSRTYADDAGQREDRCAGVAILAAACSGAVRRAR